MLNRLTYRTKILTDLLGYQKFISMSDAYVYRRDTYSSICIKMISYEIASNPYSYRHSINRLFDNYKRSSDRDIVKKKETKKLTLDQSLAACAFAF